MTSTASTPSAATGTASLTAADTAAARPLVDPVTTITEYVDRSDWRVNANANQGYSVGGMILNAAGKMTAEHWLGEVFSPAAGRAHREGDLHIHDLDMLTGYCAGWSLRALLEEAKRVIVA